MCILGIKSTALSNYKKVNQMDELTNTTEPQIAHSECYAQVFLGDCLELYKNIEPKSIDLILTDLPYGTTACKWDTIIPFDKLWEMVNYLLKPNGAFITTASQPFTSALVMSNPKMFKYELIWNKVLGKNFLLAKKMPLKSHENICVFYNNQSTYNPQKTELKNIETLKREKRLMECKDKSISEHQDKSTNKESLIGDILKMIFGKSGYHDDDYSNSTKRSRKKKRRYGRQI